MRSEQEIRERIKSSDLKAVEYYERARKADSEASQTFWLRQADLYEEIVATLKWVLDS